MEHVLFIILLILSGVEPARLPKELRPALPERTDPLPAVWSTGYPTLVKDASRRSASVLDASGTEIGSVPLYVTNRAVWQNHLQSTQSKEVRFATAARLSSLAAAVLSPDAPPDALSPAVRELATAYMDLTDLSIPVRPPSASRISSPFLAAYFALYEEGADEQDWQAFADAARRAPYRDAIHLLPRVPHQFLGHAFGLVEWIAPPAGFAEREQGVQARALMTFRIKTMPVQ